MTGELILDEIDPKVLIKIIRDSIRIEPDIIDEEQSSDEDFQFMNEGSPEKQEASGSEEFLPAYDLFSDKKGDEKKQEGQHQGAKMRQFDN